MCDESTLCDSDTSSDRVQEFNIQLIDTKDIGSLFASSQYARFPINHHRLHPAGIFSSE